MRRCQPSGRIPMTEEQRQRIIRGKLARHEIGAPPLISTGDAALDGVMGGGLPRGRIAEWFGPPSCGKTTLALRTAAHLQQSGSVAAWIDADRTFDPLYASSLGVSFDDLPVVRPESAEEAVEMGARLVESGAVDLLIVDSAAALIPRLELSAAIGDGPAGWQSRILATGLRRLGVRLRRHRAAALFLNQSRAYAGGARDEWETGAGGPALKLHAAVRLAFQPESGGRLRLRALKNPANTAFPTCVVEAREAPGRAKTP